MCAKCFTKKKQQQQQPYTVFISMRSIPLVYSNSHKGYILFTRIIPKAAIANNYVVQTQTDYVLLKMQSS